MQATAEAAKQALRKLEEEAAAAQAKIDSEKPSSLSQVLMCMSLHPIVRAA